MAKHYRVKLTGVFGNPIDENPTVVMQEAAFAAKGLNWRYVNFLVEPAGLKAAFEGMRAMHFYGINLTVPHKVEAMQYVDELSEKAKLIGAINTVVNRDGVLYGDNTDGAGFVEGMRKKGIGLAGKTAVVLGAGGASRAICVECALAGCARILLFNRTLSKAEEIAAVVNQNSGCKAEAVLWEKGLRIPQCDLLINATSIGLYPDPSAPGIRYEDITPGMIVQDIIPNPADTPFLQKARAQGAVTYDGLSMLVEQGAIGFKLWTGEDAPTDVMYAALEREFA